MWHQETLQHDILDEFREAQAPVLEQCWKRRDELALAARRRQLMAYKLRRAADKFLRVRAVRIPPLPFVPMEQRRYTAQRKQATA